MKKSIEKNETNVYKIHGIVGDSENNKNFSVNNL